MRAIDGDELIKKMNLAISMMSGMMKALDAEEDEGLQMELKAYRDIRDGIKEEPTIEPERKKGKWIYGEDITALSVDGYRCDKCGYFVPWDYTHKSIDYIKEYHFCPNCGCKMEG